MPDSDFDEAFVQFVLKFSDEKYITLGFHMNAAGWVAWVKHVAEGSGKRVTNLEALRRLERLLDNNFTNPFRRAVREQWEYQVIEVQQDRRKGPPFREKVEEAITRLLEIFAGNGVVLTSTQRQEIHDRFRIRILETVAIQMALGDGHFHVQDAAARAFRKMWADNEWDMQRTLPSPQRIWHPAFELEE